MFNLTTFLIELTEIKKKYSVEEGVVKLELLEGM